MTLMVLKSFPLSQNSACISCHLIALLFHVLGMLRSDVDFSSSFFHRRRIGDQREVNITVNMCQALPGPCCIGHIGMLCMVLTHLHGYRLCCRYRKRNYKTGLKQGTID